MKTKQPVNFTVNGSPFSLHIRKFDGFFSVGVSIICWLYKKNNKKTTFPYNVAMCNMMAVEISHCFGCLANKVPRLLSTHSTVNHAHIDDALTPCYQVGERSALALGLPLCNKAVQIRPIAVVEQQDEVIGCLQHVV